MGHGQGAASRRTSLASSLAWALARLALLALVFAGAYLLVRRENEQAARGQQQREALQRAQERQRAARLAVSDLGPVLALCREGWRDRLSLYHEPVALAWTRRGIDAYFVTGSDRSSLRQARCDAEGVSLGSRVAHPLRPLLPAEAPAASPLPAEAPPTRAEASTTPEPDERHLDLAALSQERLAPGELAVELVVDPATGALVSRRWREAPEGALASVQPPDTRPFALLVARPAFRVAGPRLPSPEALRRHDWTNDDAAAFALIGRSLPKGATLSEITLSPDKIEVTIDSPTAAFDGRPPVRYGDKTFDEYGVAETDWWYPREIPGFGCARGRTLEEVATDFGFARARLAGRPLASAWYSCSTAYGNGRHGAWHLQPQ